MQITGPYYLMKLREGLSLKQRQNPHYSLRAYARDIGIHPATLSQIINGKRPLPHKDSETVAKRLNLGPKESSLFKDSLSKSKTATSKTDDDEIKLLLEESHYKIIAEWEHYALLELFNLSHFTGTSEEISLKLDLTPNRTSIVIQNLINCGLLEKNEDGTFSKLIKDVKTTEDIVSQALRDSHKETLELGIKKLEEISMELRDFSSTTLAIDLKRLPEVKQVIREFRKKLSSFVEDGERDEIYQLAIQFYPLSNLNKKSDPGEICDYH